MSDIIGFFSSDARSLYMEGIFESLSLPQKSVMHFRYQQKYIEDDISNRLDSYKGCTGIIFFVTGNNLSTAEDQRILKYHSIRKVIIKKIEKSENTGLVHFYLELGEFCDYTINRPEDISRNLKFVTRISVTSGVGNKWIDRVAAVKEFFGPVLFFKYDILNKKGEVLYPRLSATSNDSIYFLEDEMEYVLKCAFYDNDGGKSSLSISDTELLMIHHKENEQIAATADDRSFKLITSTVSRSMTPVQIKFSPKSVAATENKYQVNAFFEIRRRGFKSVIFGVLTGAAFVSVLLTQIFAQFVKDVKPVWDIVTIGIISLVLIGISGGLLFKIFNKK